MNQLKDRDCQSGLKNTSQLDDGYKKATLNINSNHDNK